MYSAGMLDVTNACCLKHKDVIGSTCAPLSNMFGYFHAMRTCHAKLRYFDWEGHVHFAIVFVACKVPAGPGARRLLILTMGKSKAR